MPSTKDNKPDIFNSSFFLIGDSGSQKTRMLGSFPDVYIFDFDKGTASLSDRDVQFDTFKDTAKGGKVMPEHGIYAYGDAYPRFLDRINEIGVQIDKGDCAFKALGLDSATMLSNICMNYVLKSDGKPYTQPQIQHWGRQTALLETVFDQLTAWPLIKVVTAHVQRTSNDLLQTVEMLPLLTGKFAAKSAIYFDEVYFLEIERKKVDEKTVLRAVCRTQSTPILRQAKSRFGIADGIDANWDAVLKSFNGRPNAKK